MQVFVLLIAVPLMAAGLTQLWADRRPTFRRMVKGLSWLPVLCLALVLLLAAISQAGQVAHDLRGMERVVLIFVLYLAVAAIIDVLTA